MITRMEVFSSRQGTPVLPLGSGDANDDPVQIRDIQGLGPVKAEITTSPFANSDGEIFQNASVGKRNVVLSLGLNADWENKTPAQLRQLLYAYFLPKQWVKLRFFSDHMVTADIEGYVESMDPNMFSQDPEIQISIICPRPDFIDSDPTFLTGTVGVEDTPHELEFVYQGTVPTGFEMRVENTADRVSYSGKLWVTNKTPLAQRFIIDPITVDASKKFRVSTLKNAKRAQVLNPDGTTQNILARVALTSVWPLVVPGTNLLSVVADLAGQKWTLAYFNRYGGL